MKRRTTGMLLVVSMIISMVSACGSTAGNSDASKAGQDTQQETQQESAAEGSSAADADQEGEKAVTDETISEFEIPEVTPEQKELPDNEAFAFVHDMKLGWNLGNTMDATINGTAADDLAVETAWQGSITTQKMIDDVKAAGFNTLRLPVSWHNHVSGDDYTISEAWLNRVQEIVDYAYNQDMYVILNIHHDTSLDYVYPDNAHLEQSEKYMTAIWSQLTARFADYDNHLIFESINEPRLIDTKYEWWLDPKSAECQEAVTCLNSLNQSFVDTVRASGGNNAERYLMVPGYGASIDGATNSAFVLPTDTADNKLIVSVHAYTPYNFALQGENESGSVSDFDSDSTSSTRDIDSLLNRIYETFVSQGIPVVIGEFGARDKETNTQARVDYAAYYIAAARACGVTCVWWDNNSFSGNGEKFGLYYRLGGYFMYPDIVSALMKYAE